MSGTLGRPGKRTHAPQPDANVYLGWLARTHRYDAEDLQLATAASFARRLSSLPGACAIGPAMISRLESGTANWRVEHLLSYARALSIPQTWLLAPAYKVGKTFGRSNIGGLLRVHYTQDDEQTVADLLDAVRGDDPLTTADWDLLSGYLVASRRALGMRTWATLCERLLLEICATQGAEQDIRAEALIRIITLERVVTIANAEAIGTAEQAGNPMSFMPLKIFQRLPRKAPHSWIVRALLNPPDRWLLRELFTSVAVLVATGEWQPSTRQLSALRQTSADATADTDMEMEVRRAGLQLLRRLDHRASRQVPPHTHDVELVYLTKPDDGNDPQHTRYQTLAARLAAQVQDVGLRWHSKWTGGEDHILTEVLTQTLFARDDSFRSSYTTLMVNSGYTRALRLVLVRQLAKPNTYEDATIARALIRLLGKIATGERDGQALLHVIDGMGLDTNTRVQACWALANAAPRLPAHIIRAALHTCRYRPFGHQAVTALRATIASCGRAGLTEQLGELLDDHTVPLTARRECRWWLALPAGVLTSMRMTQ